jgi:hypothetical protein
MLIASILLIGADSHARAFLGINRSDPRREAFRECAFDLVGKGEPDLV